MATTLSSVVSAVPLVPRYILKGPLGYLADTIGQAAQFCARPADARVFYLRRYAQAQADKYGLEVISLNEPTESFDNIFATEKPISALELLISFCVESSRNSKYVGVQSAFEVNGTKHPAVILWNSKVTGTTLGCKIDVLSTQKVKEITDASDLKFAQFADSSLTEVAG
jgi:hypothetical protein